MIGVGVGTGVGVAVSVAVGLAVEASGGEGATTGGGGSSDPRAPARPPIVAANAPRAMNAATPASPRTRHPAAALLAPVTSPSLSPARPPTPPHCLCSALSGHKQTMNG